MQSLSSYQNLEFFAVGFPHSTLIFSFPGKTRRPSSDVQV
jgi:hypothetical protein